MSLLQPPPPPPPRGLIDAGYLDWGTLTVSVPVVGVIPDVFKVKIGITEEKDEDFSLPGLVLVAPLSLLVLFILVLITTFPVRVITGVFVAVLLLLLLPLPLLLLLLPLLDSIIGNGAGCLCLFHIKVFSERLSSLGLMDSNGSFIVDSLARRSLTRVRVASIPGKIFISISLSVTFTS